MALRYKKLFSLYTLSSGMFAIFFLMCPLYASDAVDDTILDSCFSEILSKRYSGYQFDAKKTLSHEQITQILEAGRSAPSSYNDQPWHFIVCEKSKFPQAYQKALNSMVAFNQQWTQQAPVFIICVAASNSTLKGTPNRWGQYDTGAATMTMMLKATSMGLMAHQVGGFDENQLRRDFAIPATFIPMSILVIGYRSAQEVQTERTRKNLQDNFFMNTWGQKFE